MDQPFPINFSSVVCHTVSDVWKNIISSIHFKSGSNDPFSELTRCTDTFTGQWILQVTLKMNYLHRSWPVQVGNIFTAGSWMRFSTSRNSSQGFLVIWWVSSVFTRSSNQIVAPSGTCFCVDPFQTSTRRPKLQITAFRFRRFYTRNSCIRPPCSVFTSDSQVWQMSRLTTK